MAISSNQITSADNTRIFLAVGEQAITTILFCNTSEVDTVSLDVWAVGNFDVVSDATLILKKLVLPPTETFVMDAEKFILSDSDALWAKADVDLVVSATVSSVSI